jgi:hypothetical protein
MNHDPDFGYKSLFLGVPAGYLYGATSPVVPFVVSILPFGLAALGRSFGVHAVPVQPALTAEDPRHYLFESG